MTLIDRLEDAYNAHPEPWSKSKCGCGDKVCSSWFLSFTRSDGRISESEADLVLLMKENLPLLISFVGRMMDFVAPLETAAHLCANNGQWEEAELFKRDAESLRAELEKLK